MHRIRNQGERRIFKSLLRGVLIERPKQIDIPRPALQCGIAHPRSVECHHRVIVAGGLRNLFLILQPTGWFNRSHAGIIHRRPHEKGRRAQCIHTVRQLGHPGFVPRKDLVIEMLIGAVVHTQQHGDVVGLERGNIFGKAIQRVGRGVAADPGIMKKEPASGIAGVKIILHILRVEALMRNAIPQKNKRIAILQIDRCDRRFKLRRRHQQCRRSNHAQ